MEALITAGVTATGSTSCPAPDISGIGGWIGLTSSTFGMTKGTVKLTMSEYTTS